MKFLDDNLEKEWYEEIAQGSPILVALPAHAISRGIMPAQTQYKGVACFYSDGKIYWYTLIENQDKLAKEILEKYLEDKKYYRDWFLCWEKVNQKFDDLFDQVHKANLSNLSDKRLFDLFSEFWTRAIKSRQISMITEPFTFGSERLLMQKLSAYCAKKKLSNLSTLYIDLTLPEKSSFINESELDLIEISQKLKKDKKIANLLKNPKKLYRFGFIKNHLNKYAWIRGNWGKSYPYSVEDLIEEIKKLLSENDLTNLEKQKRDLDNKYHKKREAILKKYHFPKDIKALSKLSALFVYWHDLRKINALKYIYGTSLFLKEFSKRFNLDLKDLYLFDPTEIELMIKNRRTLSKEAKKRRKLFLIVYKNSQLYPLYDKKTRYYFDKLSESQTDKDLKEIKGICASGGKATGRVRIIENKEEFSKFKPGEILVTGMTRPEFVPLMKKAAAIITNDGGITCHAAIVSRELGKPCIIGTRIATKILKDGDRVKVDADRGIVEILKEDKNEG